MLRTIRIFALVLVALLGAAWALAWATRQPGQSLAEAFATRLAQLAGTGAPGTPAAGMQPPPGGLGGAFHLQDQTGRQVSDQDYSGRWMLVYFGYTFCPDICPTELGVMAAAIDAMGPLGERVLPVFITIDPQRDTPAQLADYVSRFHPRMVGLTGTPDQVAEAARRYRVYYARAQRADMTDYLMDHSSFIYLVGPDGRVRSLFRPETRPEDIATATTARIGANGRTTS